MRRWLGLAGLLVVLGLSIVATRPDPSFAVEGSFILWDDYPGKVDGQRCTGERSLYHDINSSTRVTVETESGGAIAASALGEGRIASGEELASLARRAGHPATAAELEGLLDDLDLLPCLFTFGLNIDGAGSDDFVVRVGRWGRITMSGSDLREPGAVQLSIGLR